MVCMRVTSETYLGRCFSVLNVLSNAETPSSLHAVSGWLDLPKPTVLRLLRSLCELGYVECDGLTGHYRTSSKIFELVPVDGDAWLRDRVRPAMEVLFQQVNETTNLACLDGQRVRYVQIIESTQSLRCIPDDRLHDELLRTALGRAILAYWPSDQLKKALPELCRRANYNDIEAVGKELKRTRQRGWASESEQGCAGVDCLAVALLQDGIPYAGVSVSVPTARMTAMNRAKLITGLKELARSVTVAETIETKG